MSGFRKSVVALVLGLVVAAVPAARSFAAEGDAPAADPAPASDAAKPAAAAAPAASDYKPANIQAAGEEERKRREAEAQNQAYRLRLRTLERRVGELKEQIFKSKARLSLLAETVIAGALSGSRAQIEHVNEMGGSFEVTNLTYVLDGTPVYSWVADANKEPPDFSKLMVFDAAVVPGDHVVQVRVDYKGKSGGLFSYIDGYRWSLKQKFPFSAAEGKIVKVEVIGFERGGITTSLKQRPALKASVYTRDEAAELQQAATPAGESGQ